MQLAIIIPMHQRQADTEAGRQAGRQAGRHAGSRAARETAREATHSDCRPDSEAMAGLISPARWLKLMMLRGGEKGRG